MRAFRPAGLLLAVVLLSSCSDSDPSTVETPTPTVTALSSPTPSPTPSAAPTSTLPAGVDQLVTVTVKGGKVVGGAKRIRVKKGNVVRLVVTSDVADEVHLHTYDKSVDVAADGRAALTFTASIPGVMLAELENHHLTLVRFQVQ